MDELMQKLNGYLDAAENVLREYGPQAMEAALLVVRLDAIWRLAMGLILLGALVALCMKAYQPVERLVASGEPEAMLLIIPGFLLLTLIFCVAALLSPVYWITAIDPMLGLVYRAAQAAGLL